MIRIYAYIAFSIIAIASLGTASAEEACATIDNDISRLACYDSQAAANAPDAPDPLTPDEAFAEFVAFAADPSLLREYKQESLDFHFDDCILEGSKSKYGKSYSKEDRLEFIYFRLDLRHTTVNGWLGTSPNFIEVTQSRDQAVNIRNVFITPPESWPIAGDRTIVIGRGITNNYEGWYEFVRMNSLRTARFQVVREVEDGPAAMKLFKAIVQACELSG